MKVLIVSKEVWRNDMNGGNTLTGYFKGFPENTEFAQIFCSDGTPYNDICDNYYKLTTKMVGKLLLKRTKDSMNMHTDVHVQKTVIEKSQQSEIKQNNSIKSSVKNFMNSEIIRDFVWGFGTYKLESLKEYVKEYNPDIIFAPGYGVKYMNYLIQWISTFVSCPIVSLISDDYYSLRQVRFSPFFWIRHFNIRRTVRKSAKLYSLIYTMTTAQEQQLLKDFKRPVKILLRGMETPDELPEKNVGSPITFVYAGNLYYNRWKTLKLLSDGINKADSSDGNVKFTLKIYSNSIITDEIRKAFSEYPFVEINKSVSSDELKKIYDKADIALHVEGFDFYNRELVRLSFSTKIVDCITSGCAVMCICHKDQGGYVYLDSNKSAICASSKEEIGIRVTEIKEDTKIISEYRKKAYMLAKKNHVPSKISDSVVEDFRSLLKG